MFVQIFHPHIYFCNIDATSKNVFIHQYSSRLTRLCFTHSRLIPSQLFQANYDINSSIDKEKKEMFIRQWI
jgi:hypothetical protein